MRVIAACSYPQTTLCKIAPQDVLEASFRFKADTAIGCDMVEVAMWRNMSHHEASEIAQLLNMIEEAVAWPIQCLLNIIVLMGKPAGGVRPIALMPMIYRLWTKIRKVELSTWEDKHHGP